MINVEIEIVSADAKNAIYELRNYLAENVENLQITIKEQPGMEGEMSLFSAETILNGVIHAGVGLGIERCIHILWPLIKEWIKEKNVRGDKKIEVLATLGDSTSSVTISEDSEGISKRYDNVTYSIDKSHTRAILIGCGEFGNDFLPIPPVKGNLEDLYRLLTDKRNIGLLPENVTVVFNKTNTEIEETLLRISKLPDTETLLIYFSGHGYRSDVNKLYLIARNTRKIDDYILSGVDYDFIKNAILKSSPAKQKIVILDACHSGIATQGMQDTILDVNVTGTYVLASSESDEVSYYDRNKRNTFFTGALLDILSNGIDNEREMLALNDLYEYSKSHLDQKQQPRFKDKLSISSGDFFVARNPSFSFEKNIQKAIQLYKSGKLATALKEFKKIVQRQPDNEEVKKLADQCNSDLLSVQFIREADELFYHGRNYKKALDLYQQAYDLRPDFSIAEKIDACKDYLDAGHTGIVTNPPEPAIKPSTPPGEEINDAEEKEERDEGKDAKPKKIALGKKIFALIVTLAIIGIGWLLLNLVSGHKDKTSIRELSNLLSTDPGTALQKLQRAKQKDSANYVLGNYFREEEQYDTAAHFYKKAIASSQLPAAYSALAEMYYWGKLDDSAANSIAYSLLKTADSLHKADTTAFYLLGSIADNRIRRYQYIGFVDGSDPVAEAEKYYLKGLKNDCKRCVESMAFYYLTQVDNPVAALPYMKKAAENNSVMAELYLSDMLERGIGTVADTAEAQKWFNLYAQNASADELAERAMSFHTGLYGSYHNYELRQDCKKALQLYREAENKAGMITMSFRKIDLFNHLGNFYEFGCKSYVAKNLKKASEYYKTAYDLGDPAAESDWRRLKVK
ncbi:MAG TPA: caspase family protein [Chitinophagaceae bacterium]|nr:caspase family protein [Chitinophagaceae bacterium]